MKIWLIMILGGLITFGLRFSLIYLFGRFTIPEFLRRALRYVPPAVLSALIFVELFLEDGRLNISLSNERLIAGVVAMLAAVWISRNTLVTILVGMLAFLLLKFLGA